MSVITNPYLEVGSGSMLPPEYAKGTDESTSTGGVRRFLEKTILFVAIAPQCWGALGTVTSNELFDTESGYSPFIRADYIGFVETETQQESNEVLLSIEDQIKEINETLCPGGMSSIASMLGVSRPTIYKWFDGANNVKPENQERLAKLIEVVKSWKGKVVDNMPSGLIKRRLPSGVTLFDLLSTPEIDMDAVNEAVNLLAKSYNRSLVSFARLEGKTSK